MTNFENKIRNILSYRDNTYDEVIAKNVSGSRQAFQVSKNDDIFKVINEALDDVGQDGKVIVENGRYNRQNGKAPRSQLRTSAEGQYIDFQGSDFELDDGVDDDMVNVQHDSCKLENVNLNGNQQNNNITDVLKTGSETIDCVLQNVECGGAEHGIHLVNANEATVFQSGTELESDVVDIPIYLEQCSDASIMDAKFSSYVKDGIRIDDSTAIDVQNFASILDDTIISNTGIRIKGSQGCYIQGAITARGFADVGIQDEPYDIGGANERISTRNTYNLNLSGVNDIGFHISDAEKHKIDGLIDGETPTGRTSQAFLIDAPNGLANPQHTIDISGSTLDRITDTSLTGTNAGVRVNGHYSRISNVSDVTFGGESQAQFTFGQATPDPTVNVNSGTRLVVRQTAKKEKTGASGQIDFDWSKRYAFEDKPILTATLEQAGHWYIDTYDTDAQGRYTGATIQVTDPSGTPVGNNVQVNLKLQGV